MPRAGTSTVGVQSAAAPGRGDTAGREGAGASRSVGAGSGGSGSSDDDSADGDDGGAAVSRYSISARAVTLKQSRDGACRFDDGGHDSSVGTEAR